MAGFKQAKSDFPLRIDPQNGSAVVAGITITLTDKLEVVGDPVTEKLGAAELVWIHVKCAKGEGFADNELLGDFVEPAPVPDEVLSPEFRHSVELTTLAEFCYRNALRQHTNSALLLALAHAATGKQWTDTTAKPPKEGGDRVGIYGFTQKEWDAALVGVPANVDVKSDQIALARAQCEIAGVLSGRHWEALVAARGDEVHAIDLYLAFLFGADIAIQILKADDETGLSAFLTDGKAQIVAARAAVAVPDSAIAPDTQKKALVKALADKLQVAFDFVKAFAESLMTDQQPAPQGEIIKTEREIDHEDPTGGEDDAIGPSSPIVTPSIPKPAPQPNDGTLLVSEAHLVALWKRSLFPIDGRGVILFGLRGCLPVDSSSMDFAGSHKIKLAAVNYVRMRCTIGQWQPGKGFALFPGSTVPFLKLVKTAKDRGGAGVNQMGCGRYRNYEPGWHKQSEGPKGHWALLQASDITFQRTADDLDYDLDDRWDAGRPGDNIHCAFHMGKAGQPEESQYSSAGCQVVAGTVVKGKKGSEEGPWKKFIAPFLDDGDQAGFEYVLFDGTELERMVRTGMDGESVVLRIGSEGALVADLQQRLGLPDPDGKLGPNTFRAVVKFQQQNFPTTACDGVVKSQSAAKLGMVLPQFVFDDARLGLSLAGPGPTSGSGPGLGTTASRAETGAAAAGEGLCWGKVTDQLHGPAFKQKVREISGRLGCDPNHLMAVMAFESGRTFSPKVKNPASSATGLIQFMADTAVGLGTTTDRLAAMTAIKQLDFVEKYLKPHSGKMNTVSDIYMAVLLPVAIGKPESHVLFKRGTDAYKVNRGLDVDKDGAITKSEAAAKVVQQLNLGMTKENFG